MLDEIKEGKIEEGDYYTEIDFYRFNPEFKKVTKQIKIEIDDKYDFISYENIAIGSYLGMIKYLFPEWDVQDFQNIRPETGHPDFKLLKEGEVFYIEYKSPYDSISKSQLDWVCENKAKIYFLFVHPIRKKTKPISERIIRGNL